MFQKGFTLIELLVVIAIIGVLAAVGVVAFNGFISSAKENATKQNHKMIVKQFTILVREFDLSGSINKKENITPKNIGEIMLMQIPGVSSTSAITIMKEFGSFMNVIDAVKDQDIECLKKLTYETKTGKKRHISSTCCKNIVKYLIEKKDEVLFIET